jgi:hypothetical protein
MALYFYSERFQPSGNIDAQAARRAIGKPSLDQWRIFLRETLQNSWDARLRDEGPIGFSVDAWRAAVDQKAVLLEEVFRIIPPDSDLHYVLNSEDLGLLLISDIETRGLGGPTRADIASDERTDFVDFVRNVGRDKSKGYAGGTYGFGKAVLYDASACSTIIIYTRTRFRGELVSRFMGISLGSAYSDKHSCRFTGRHWWGLESDTTGAEPVTGATADSLAARIGITTIPEGATGTAILIIAPVAYEDEDLAQCVGRLAKAATWYAWPHMMEVPSRRRSIDFSFRYEGASLRMPDVSTHAVLRHFAGAYLNASSVLAGTAQPGIHWPWETIDVRSERPNRRLGVLSYRRYQHPGHSSAGDSPQEKVFSHVALMRNQRFVVQYFEIPADAGGAATAGVFIADPSVDKEFALAEPVAHDAWVPEYLQRERYQRNPVRQALQRIRAAFRPRLAEPSADESSTGFTGVARLSSMLGELLVGQAGGTDARVRSEDPKAGSSGRRGAGRGRAGAGRTGAGSGARPAGGLGGGANARFEIASRPRMVLAEGRIAVEFDLDVIRFPSGLQELYIRAEPIVVIDGSLLETPNEVPVGAERPRVLGWANRESGDWTPGPTVTIRPEEAAQWSVRVSQPDDTAISVILETVEGSLP